MHQPTTADIDSLLAFLPLFGAEGFNPEVGREPAGTGEVPQSGEVSLRGPQYVPSVEAFMVLAAGECWRDTDYRVHGGARVQDAESVSSASLQDVRAMLTFLLRAERFSEGSLGEAFRVGAVQALLRRMAELRSN